MKAHNFRELQIWQEAMQLVRGVYRLTDLFPEKERYGLVAQMNRCAVSIPSNIAEGSGRGTEKEFIRFLNISQSSSYELETQLILVTDLYEFNTEELIAELKVVQNKIGGFIRMLKTTQNPNVPIS